MKYKHLYSDQEIIDFIKNEIFNILFDICNQENQLFNNYVNNTLEVSYKGIKASKHNITNVINIYDTKKKSEVIINNKLHYSKNNFKLIYNIQELNFILHTLKNIIT